MSLNTLSIDAAWNLIKHAFSSALRQEPQILLIYHR